MVKKEQCQTFCFVEMHNRKHQKKQILIDKNGAEVILDESKIQ
jgi:hypothetical protein